MYSKHYNEGHIFVVPGDMPPSTPFNVSCDTLNSILFNAYKNIIKECSLNLEWIDTETICSGIKCRYDLENYYEFNKTTLMKAITGITKNMAINIDELRFRNKLGMF